ncbi:MAG: SurA N-terminal domain-containing protein [Nitrospirota bacterium]|nr:MAG: SurA N-terminal domain-containing protein [Nitrospirota bacterium]
MLQFMKKHAKFFYIFFFLIIISFIFFYVPPADEPGTLPVIEVEKERVLVDEFWRTHDRLRESYRDVYKEKFDAEMEKSLNLKERVLNQLLSAKILYLAALDMGLEVTDDELREVIMAQEAFRRDGQFVQSVYERTLQLNRLTPRYFEAKMREDLLVGKITRLIEATVVLTDEEVPQVQGNEALAAQIKEAVINEKRSKAVDAFVESMKSRFKVIMRAELIA